MHKKSKSLSDTSTTIGEKFKLIDAIQDKLIELELKILDISPGSCNRAIKNMELIEKNMAAKAEHTLQHMGHLEEFCKIQTDNAINDAKRRVELLDKKVQKLLEGFTAIDEKCEKFISAMDAGCKKEIADIRAICNDQAEKITQHDAKLEELSEKVKKITEHDAKLEELSEKLDTFGSEEKGKAINSSKSGFRHGCGLQIGNIREMCNDQMKKMKQHDVLLDVVFQQLSSLGLAPQHCKFDENQDTGSPSRVPPAVSGFQLQAAQQSRVGPGRPPGNFRGRHPPLSEQEFREQQTDLCYRSWSEGPHDRYRVVGAAMRLARARSQSPFCRAAI